MVFDPNSNQITIQKNAFNSFMSAEFINNIKIHWHSFLVRQFNIRIIWRGDNCEKILDEP